MKKRPRISHFKLYYCFSERRIASLTRLEIERMAHEHCRREARRLHPERHRNVRRLQVRSAKENIDRVHVADDDVRTRQFDNVHVVPVVVVAALHGEGRTPAAREA